MENGVKVHQG
jgi:transposase